MMDIHLPVFLDWDDRRIKLKHNWFDRLAGIVRMMTSGSEVPTFLMRWTVEYPNLCRWLEQTETAISPAQILDLELFHELSEESVNSNKGWLHQQFLKNCPIDIREVTDNCLQGLATMNNEIEKILAAKRILIDDAKREDMAASLEAIASELRKFPDKVEWYEPRPDSLPKILVVDDLLGRDAVMYLNRAVISNLALRELTDLKRAFCAQFNLTDGSANSNEPLKPIACAYFCAGQKWDKDKGFVNDFEVIKKTILEGPNGNKKPEQWSLIIADVYFNTGIPNEHGFGKGEGMFGIDYLIPWLRENHPEIPIVALTTESSSELIGRVRSLGVEYLHRGTANDADMMIQLNSGGRVSKEALKASLGVPDKLVFEDPQMIPVLLEAWAAAKDKDGNTVLITGEPGSGKEVLANFIHTSSPRAKGPRKFVNCKKYSNELGMSQLFGYYKGAFTDAKQDTEGDFHKANGGTIVLDEFADLDEKVQGMLLRTLEPKPAKERPLEPVGNRPPGSRLPTTVDVRVICCTNRELNLLREDLKSRVGKIIEIPPLKQRPLDVVPLALYFLHNSEHMDLPGIEIDQSGREFLTGIDLPGNARTLKYLIEEATIGKGKRNILTRVDLEKAWRSVQRKYSLEKIASPPMEEMKNVQEVVHPLEESDNRGGRETGQQIQTFEQAVAKLMTFKEQELHWDSMSLKELKEIDSALKGEVWKAFAVLAEWMFYRAEDAPSIVEYYTGQKLPSGRTPQDVVGRVLKLDYNLFQYLSERISPTNPTIKKLFEKYSDFWSKKEKSDIDQIE
jgi:DNA-binding NtrC family response regulator